MSGAEDVNGAHLVARRCSLTTRPTLSSPIESQQRVKTEKTYLVEGGGRRWKAWEGVGRRGKAWEGVARVSTEETHSQKVGTPGGRRHEADSICSERAIRIASTRGGHLRSSEPRMESVCVWLARMMAKETHRRSASG